VTHETGHGLPPGTGERLSKPTRPIILESTHVPPSRPPIRLSALLTVLGARLIVHGAWWTLDAPARQ
jgi:hypothetical protein